jgi:hypothetical protein
VPETLLKHTQKGLFATPRGRSLIARGLQTVVQALPTDPGIEAYLKVSSPDVLAVTPLIEPGAPQAEYLRCARALGIRTALCVASWDNLTNKGLIHGAVDLVAVWNDAMKQEALTFHGIADERVAVTGAQPFDHWFSWSPSTTREEFCRKVGLPADKPYILYLCSSGFIAPQESEFIFKWVEQLRQSGLPALADAGVLVRPHPQNFKQWRDVDLSQWRDVAVWPRAGAAPSDQQSRQDYFDSIYHCGAAVGVNTTAEIEAAIVGRGVFTVLAPEFKDTQDGTLHFEHLRRAGGGLVHVGKNMADHLGQLDAALRDSGPSQERCRRFVEAFVRPYGIEEAAAPRLVRALEDLARAQAPVPVKTSRWATLAGALVRSRGDRLQREAFTDREAKAARERKKQRTAPPAGGAVGPELLEYAGAEIRLQGLSAGEAGRLNLRLKDPFTTDWLHGLMQSGEVLYDIGARVGAFSLIGANRSGGAARVYAFESDPGHMASLCANVALNGASSQVTPLPLALSDVEGLTHRHGQPVMTGRLDDVIARFGLPQPHHIRLCFDGSEPAALDGATMVLASPTLRSVMIEAGAAPSDSVLRMLERHGLTLGASVTAEGEDVAEAAWYGVFVRSERPDAREHTQEQRAAG